MYKIIQIWSKNYKKVSNQPILSASSDNFLQLGCQAAPLFARLPSSVPSCYVFHYDASPKTAWESRSFKFSQAKNWVQTFLFRLQMCWSRTCSHSCSVSNTLYNSLIQFLPHEKSLTQDIFSSEVFRTCLWYNFLKFWENKQIKNF